MRHGQQERAATTSQPSFEARTLKTAVHAPSTVPPPPIPAVLVGLGRPNQKLDKFRESVNYLNSLEADEDAPGAYKARAHPNLGGLLVARCIARTQLANLDPTRLVLTLVACVDCKSACVQEHDCFCLFVFEFSDSPPHNAVTVRYTCQLDAQVGAYGGASGLATVRADCSRRFMSAVPWSPAPNVTWTPGDDTGYPLVLGPGLCPAPFLIVEHEWNHRPAAALVHLGRTYALEPQCKAIVLSKIYNRRVGTGRFAGFVLVLLRNVNGMYVHQFLSFGTAPLDAVVIRSIRRALIEPHTALGHAVPTIQLTPHGTVGVDVGQPPVPLDNHLGVSPRELLSVETHPDRVVRRVSDNQLATWTWSEPPPLPMSITIPGGLIPVVHGMADFPGDKPVPAPPNFQAPPLIMIDLMAIVMAHGRATPYAN
ncbi:hypothetical protein H257_04346 [Aphanomyces astaci]|uniref:Uncharacterized protein n=2 Tax=Aphanomyces astaci TaxID=112090 RepID=W4GVI6_APHAT|nr:hypothetical protein H257_04346 [Aphanomyces astaci]ETV83677.1 hypothetical protein H257_04346 [Aphanomyces astaci]|eukprot:XP_009827107.1 hypothetical protein H257_04346 [Aphanomyces astaci]